MASSQPSDPILQELYHEVKKYYTNKSIELNKISQIFDTYSNKSNTDSLDYFILYRYLSLLKKYILIK